MLFINTSQEQARKGTCVCLGSEFTFFLECSFSSPGGEGLISALKKEVIAPLLASGHLRRQRQPLQFLLGRGSVSLSVLSVVTGVIEAKV